LLSDVESIAENDQLDDLVIVRGKVEGKHQRFWQSSLVKIAVDICGDDEVSLVLNHSDHIDRQSFTDDIALGPFPDRCLPLVVS